MKDPYLLLVLYRLILAIGMEKICTCTMMSGLIVGAFSLSSTGKIPPEPKFSDLTFFRILLQFLMLCPERRLDVGDGKEVNLDKCPRTDLQSQCIKYLGPVSINTFNHSSQILGTCVTLPSL